MRYLANHIACFKQQHKPTLPNTLAHKKAKEVNNYWAPGCKAKMAEICKLLTADPKLQPSNMTKEEKELVIKELENHHKQKLTGARVSNCAAMIDYLHTVQHAQQLYNGLEYQMGIIGFGLFSCTHATNTAIPTFVESKQALDFITDQFDTTLPELSNEFELWACTKGAKPGDRLHELQKECARMIADGLNTALGWPNGQMNYKNYDLANRQCYGIHPRGWPKGVDFKAPSRITHIKEIHSLYNSLKLKECVWAPMSEAEISKLTDSIKEKPVKTWKTQSDQGKTHKKSRKHVRNENQENEDPNANTASKPPKT
ncbi:hypothetical protein NP233_g9819 [Leucocoprinus birnbaumii]|uniref:Uncharacterized protein n=1 Tax=Leucocoprinus birnbaumii TaxID=56174 RepID=A0AAD5YSI5_9AGAR|nr:hypothetical protein NP233_g9819 [Leucocoprinus birnbaumii]